MTANGQDDRDKDVSSSTGSEQRLIAHYSFYDCGNWRNHFEQVSTVPSVNPVKSPGRHSCCIRALIGLHVCKVLALNL